MTMIRFSLLGLIAAGVLVGSTSAARAGSGGKMPCDKILAASEEAGGSKSPDQLAKQLGTNPTRVRHCMARTQGGKKPAPVRKQPAPGEPQPSPQ